MLSKLEWSVLVLVSCLASVGCAAEATTHTDVKVLRQSLEDGCADARADLVGDVVSVLSSTDPLDPAEPQVYGSAACGGVVFEFANPDEEPLHGAWVQASGTSRSASDALSESRCPGRELQADYWGYKDKEWMKLAAAEASATFEADAQYCNLDALIMQEGTFEKLRIVARVTQGSETYPMHACVW
jgi:hypothetical protein